MKTLLTQPTANLPTSFCTLTNPFTETGLEISCRLGQKGFHGVELLSPRGVISFSKFDHRPSDQAYSQS